MRPQFFDMDIDVVPEKKRRALPRQPSQQSQVRRIAVAREDDSRNRTLREKANKFRSLSPVRPWRDEHTAMRRFVALCEPRHIDLFREMLFPLKFRRPVRHQGQQLQFGNLARKQLVQVHPIRSERIADNGQSRAASVRRWGVEHDGTVWSVDADGHEAQHAFRRAR